MTQQVLSFLCMEVAAVTTVPETSMWLRFSRMVGWLPCFLICSPLLRKQLTCEHAICALMLTCLPGEPPVCWNGLTCSLLLMDSSEAYLERVQVQPPL